ncbi:MAG: hypothetical protein FWD25_07135 [Clostridia bacterium]|nr:hypothetical protein [Clostridia bacterium]
MVDDEYWKKSSSWSKDARPGYITATDRFGIERKISVGLVLFPHHTVYSNFGQSGEMCMFYGDDKRGYARDHGNKAALNAFNGIHEIVPPVKK